MNIMKNSKEIMVGDLVRRKVRHGWINQPYEVEQFGIGVVISRKWTINLYNKYYCLSVYYPKVNKIYEISEDLMEAINERE